MTITIQHNLPTETTVKRVVEKGYKALRDLRVGEFFGMVVKQTPVDTGEARGGWRITSGGPATSPDGSLDPHGEDTIARGIVSLKNIHHFANVYVSNPVEHMRFLEEGSSQQAPVGVLRVILPAFKNMHGDVE